MYVFSLPINKETAFWTRCVLLLYRTHYIWCILMFCLMYLWQFKQVINWIRYNNTSQNRNSIDGLFAISYSWKSLTTKTCGRQCTWQSMHCYHLCTLNCFCHLFVSSMFFLFNAGLNKKNCLSALFWVFFVQFNNWFQGLLNYSEKHFDLNTVN